MLFHNRFPQYPHPSAYPSHSSSIQFALTAYISIVAHLYKHSSRHSSPPHRRRRPFWCGGLGPGARGMGSGSGGRVWHFWVEEWVDINFHCHEIDFSVGDSSVEGEGGSFMRCSDDVQHYWRMVNSNLHFGFWHIERNHCNSVAPHSGESNPLHSGFPVGGSIHFSEIRLDSFGQNPDNILLGCGMVESYCSAHILAKGSPYIYLSSEQSGSYVVVNDDCPPPPRRTGWCHRRYPFGVLKKHAQKLYSFCPYVVKSVSRLLHISYTCLTGCAQWVSSSGRCKVG